MNLTANLRAAVSVTGVLRLTLPKRGKSTLLNALFGLEVVPTGVVFLTPPTCGRNSTP